MPTARRRCPTVMNPLVAASEFGFGFLERKLLQKLVPIKDTE